MLTCRDLTVQIRRAPNPLISGVTATFERGRFHAVIGPSGCGKTTFLKALVGILPSTGEIRFNGINPVAESISGIVGFAPQFSIAYPKLSVGESVGYALQLYRSDVPIRDIESRRILSLVGLSEQMDSPVERLSGGQLRRLGLAIELSANPDFLLCDEVTSGLDPVAEEEILQLLRHLCQKEGKTILCVIHNLDALSYFDSVSLFFRGEIKFQGTISQLRDDFKIADIRDCYHALQKGGQIDFTSPEKEENELGPPDFESKKSQPPHGYAQWFVLVRRRLSLFVRDRGQLALFLALTFGFPCLVVIFALKGLPQVQTLALDAGGGIIEKFQKTSSFQLQSAKTGALVSGLIMFQIILLSLMGSNNGAREIVAERPIYEKERLSGLNPFAYIASKLFFVGLLCALQGCWMTVFVKWVCGFPGSWLGQSVVLSCVTMAIGFLCLGLSSLLTSTEKASLFALYFVGFQLPLAGVVLALPDYLIWVVRPEIGAYWGWSGYLKLMEDNRIYDVVRMTVNSQVAPFSICILFLLFHIFLGVALTVLGSLLRRSL